MTYAVSSLAGHARWSMLPGRLLANFVRPVRGAHPQAGEAGLAGPGLQLAHPLRRELARATVQRRMGPHSVVESDPFVSSRAANPSASSCRYTASYLSERHSRSMNALSIQRPRPSIKIRTPAYSRQPVNTCAVNWLPRSVFKVSGAESAFGAPSAASTQNSLSSVFDSSKASTYRLAQSWSC